jgi:multicomponent K+:H+ antiporter subunit F
MVVNAIALIVLYDIRSGSALSFEAAILFAMTGFVSSVAFAKYLTRGSIIE